MLCFAKRINKMYLKEIDELSKIISLEIVTIRECQNIKS